MKIRSIICDYQPYINYNPIPPAQLRASSVSADEVTIEAWQEIWIKNIKANKEHFGSFRSKSLGNLFNQYYQRPVIVAGSGPSLKHNVAKLKDRAGIPLLSCLHNFHYFEDHGVEPEYYVSLDAGPVVIEEISEGGSRTPDEYWELTKDRKLIAFIGSNPELFKKWQGEIYLFNAPVPSAAYEEKVDEIEKFRINVSNGGNVLGACMYIAKAFLGSAITIFVGADFSFDQGDGKFHSWSSKYDANKGYCVTAFDVFGNKVLTWASYLSFKHWFDWVATTIPGIFINCSEGGCLGSYPDGNLMQIRQMDLEKCIDMFSMSRHIKENVLDTENSAKKILF